MPNTTVPADALGLPAGRRASGHFSPFETRRSRTGSDAKILASENPRPAFPKLNDLLAREKLRAKIEAAVQRLIDALDAIDAPATDLEDGHDAEAVNEDGGDINDEGEDRYAEPNTTGIYGNSGVLTHA